MKFGYEWLQSYFNKPLPKPEKLAELLTLHSFEIESINDSVLDINVLPNRMADCAAHWGIAREISTITNLQPNTPFQKPKASLDLKTGDYIQLEIDKTDLCQRYIAVLIKNVKIDPSPDWLKQRLENLGQKSINNVVDAANYAMLETGQPLHVFDLAKIGQKKIVVRQAKEKEKITTLDNKEITLQPLDLVIADGAGDTLAIAGIKGGKKAEITGNTKDIIIEAAVFNPASIRQTSKRINLKTDASLKFEHGISLFLPEIAAERLVGLIAEIAGGQSAEKMIDFFPVKPNPVRLFLEEEDLEKILGVNIKLQTAENILINLGFNIEREGKTLIVYPPKERTDISLKEDLVEEVARIYGYEKIPSRLPKNTKTEPAINEEYAYTNWLKTILKEAGFTEVYNYSFCSSGSLELANPKSPDKKYLRESLFPGLLQSVDFNSKNFDSVKLFEIGKVFSSVSPDSEKTHVALAIGGKKNKTDALAELRGAAQALFIDDPDNYIKNNSFEISLKQIIEAAKEKGIDPEELPEFKTKNFEYKPFSKFPAITRDISLFVPADTRIEDIADIIENTGGELLIDNDLFDEYTPPNEEKKSLAFRLVFQSFDKTLTDNEVNEIRDEIIKALEQNTQWEVRK